MLGFFSLIIGKRYMLTGDLLGLLHFSSPFYTNERWIRDMEETVSESQWGLGRELDLLIRREYISA